MKLGCGPPPGRCCDDAHSRCDGDDGCSTDELCTFTEHGPPFRVRWLDAESKKRESGRDQNGGPQGQRGLNDDRGEGIGDNVLEDDAQIGGALFMSNKELLSELPSQALGVVCRKTTGTVPTTRAASALHVFDSQGPSRSFRARTPLAFPCLTNRLREHPKKLPAVSPPQRRPAGRGRLAPNLRLLCL